MKYKGYLIDLDGTIFKGTDIIPGAKEFIDELNNRELSYLFVTNNSSLTAEFVVDKLKDMNIKVHTNQVLTSSIATAKFIKKQAVKPSCFVIGEIGLISALRNEGIIMSSNDVTHVVTGIDRSITYDKLSEACMHVRNGAQFISTNSDRAIPTEKGLQPGNGALTAVISTSTNKDPIFIGKPEKTMMDVALSMINLKKDEVMLIGDNYLTDIKAGINYGIDTALVLTGISQEADIKDKELPNYILKDLSEFKFE